jgi:hypothetical protein
MIGRWRGRPPGRLPDPGMRAALALAALTAASCAAGGGSAPSSLLGTWTFFGDDSLIGTQPNVGSQRLAGTSIRIAEGPTGAELDVGCLCHIPLSLENDRAASVKNTTAGCHMILFNNDVQISGQTWSLMLDDGPTPVMRLMGQGTAFIGQMGGSSLMFSLGGQLRQRADLVPHCVGDKETGVGVLPSLDLTAQCPTGTGSETVSFFMDNEDQGGCNNYSWGGGPTFWGAPEGVKPPDPCATASPLQDTQLAFCRVDGDLFRPFVEDPRGGGSYALLQLGRRCPEGSVAVTKHISNESSNNDNSSGGINLGPNQSVNSLHSTFTELHFCLFQPRAAAAGVQSEFPDLGLPYAVIHDFDGFQPPWVIQKAWVLSEDELTDNRNAYDPVAGAPTDDLKRMVEDYRRQLPDGEHIGTFFDVARVR